MEKTVTLTDLEKILEGALSKEQADAVSEALFPGELVLDLSSPDLEKTPLAVRALGKESLSLAKRFTQTAILLGFEPDDELRSLVFPENAGQRMRFSAPTVSSLLPASFEASGFPQFKNTVREVVLGARKGDGGSDKG